MNPDPNDLVIQLLTAAPMFAFALVFHEFSHAVVANRLGDRLAAWTGRLTLDPRPHLDPMGSIAMPVLGIVFGWWNGMPGLIFGWAKPVPLNPRDLRNRSRDMMLIALAGPAANLALLVVFAFAIRGLTAAGVTSNSSASMLLEMAAFGVYINALLAVFNMIPLPPLDGSKVLAFFLGGQLRSRLLSLNPSMSFMVVLFLVFSGRLSGPLIAAIHFGERLAGIPIAQLLY